MDAKESEPSLIALPRPSQPQGDGFLAGATATLSEAASYKVQFAVHDRLTVNGQVASPAGSGADLPRNTSR